MRRIAVVGTGRLATSLVRTFGERIVAVAGRDAARIASLAALVPGARALSIDAIADVELDVLWLATSESALHQCVAEIAAARPSWSGVVVVHSSGAYGIEPVAPFAARGARCLALHPNASLRGDERVPAATIWGATPNDAESIETAHDILGIDADRVIGIVEEHRALYHAAASTAANFSVTLFAMAELLYERAGVGHATAIELVAGFMRTSVARARDGARATITGPLARGESDVVTAQEEAIRRYAPELEELFAALVAATRALILR